MELKKRCSFIDSNGRRCRIKSAITNRLHLDGELYDCPSWVEVNLCPEHHLHFGGDFKPKKNEKKKKVKGNPQTKD